MYVDDTSDLFFDLFKVNNNNQSGRIWDSKSTTSTKLVSNNASKNTAVSLVDMILLEESSCAKHSKTLVAVVCL